MIHAWNDTNMRHVERCERCGILRQLARYGIHPNQHGPKQKNRYTWHLPGKDDQPGKNLGSTEPPCRA